MAKKPPDPAETVDAGNHDEAILRQHFGANLALELFDLLRSVYAELLPAAADLDAARAEVAEAQFEASALARFRPPSIADAEALGVAIRESQKRVAAAAAREGAAMAAMMRVTWLSKYAPELGFVVPPSAPPPVPTALVPEAVQEWFMAHKELDITEWMRPHGWSALARQPVQKPRGVLRTVQTAPVNRR